MRLLVVADGDANDQLTWSGAPANAIAALIRQECEVITSKSFRVPRPLRFVDRVIRKITGRTRVLETIYQARVLEREFRESVSDFIIGFAVSGAFTEG